MIELLEFFEPEPDNVIAAVFSPRFRADVYQMIRACGVNRAKEQMINDGFHPSFVNAIVKSIIGKEGW